MNIYIEHLRSQLADSEETIRLLKRQLKIAKSKIKELEEENMDLQVYKSISENKDLLTEQIRKDFQKAIEEISNERKLIHSEEDPS